MITRLLKSGQPDDMMGFLRVPGPNGKETMELADFLTMGRDGSNTLVVNDDAVSSRHARIEKKSNGFLLRDLRSRNGTYVNGARVLEAMLNDGDRIRLGETELLSSITIDLPYEGSLTSRNEKWAEELRRVSSIAVSDLPVPLLGPSGSGKEVMAHELHRLSSRCRGPFVSVNCSALSESLVESELFGHVKGSFTGAGSDRKGAFEAARGGSLFLDEIGDLALDLQPKLLRALENRQIRPVGSDRNIETDARILVATHHNLRKKVDEGTFRADLYFRLHVVQIQTPALADRMEDFEHLLYRFARQYRVAFSHNAIQRLKEHAWPGNIRELKNVVARAKAYFPDCQIEESDLSKVVEFARPGFLDNPISALGKPSRSLIREIESEMIRSRLVANFGNQRKTAEELGMAKSTLHDRIRTYNIDIKELLGGKKPGT